jgi:benzoyl-CoA reductase/2-hydroxyglutaryl-CoA dehydratase subunit BcrC/BadD/HgdB
MKKKLKANKRLHSLIRNQILWTKFAHAIGKKVAWVTSGAPVEILLAFGIVPFYPENHAAILAARSLSHNLCAIAEEQGYDRCLCSYFRTDYGYQLSGASPLRKLPKPDLVVVCNNICGTVQNWFRITAQHYNIPYFFIDTPFVDNEPRESQVEYVKEQLVETAQAISRLVGRDFSLKNLRAVALRSMQTLELWQKILAMGMHKPAPWTSFDAFVHMAPIVSMRGTRRALWFYEALYKELVERVKEGTSAVEGEKTRVVWDNIAIWPAHKELRKFFEENGVALVADTYTGAWNASSSLVEEDPLLGLAKAYLDIILNRGIDHREKVLMRLVKEFSADGFILHNNRSCKRFSIGQKVLREKVIQRFGVPGIVIEADMADPSLVSLEQIKQRLSAFFEMLS